LSCFIVGVGLMGSLDGIIFHQLLQWHHVLHHTEDRVKLISDGVFNIVVTFLFLWGAIELFRQSGYGEIQHRWGIFTGALLMGGGFFNFFEGLLVHQILQLHHVKPGDSNEVLYDMLYLLSGVIVFLIGYMISKRAAKCFSSARPF
jgi:uncharacterized membrane protein